MTKCGQKKGLFGSCKRESLHPGDHDNGKTTWPRIGTDLRIYQAAIVELERLRAEQRRMDEAVQHATQERPRAAVAGSCDHSFEYHMEFGDIKYQNGDPYREFWHVKTCSNCGETRREHDQYYGDDMAQIHLTWRR